MATFERGVARRITLEIEYPDGSTKTAEISNPQDVASISFVGDGLDEEHRGLFEVSAADWKQNPAMLIHGRADPAAPRPPRPYCTHNGCK